MFSPISNTKAMSQPKDLLHTAPVFSDSRSPSPEASLPDDLAEACSLDDSWIPPLRDRPGHGAGGSETKWGWPQSPARVGGEESAGACHLIDTEPAASQGDESLPEIPGFLILGECGRGGMGVVYLAEQTDLGRRVGLKFLKPELAVSAAQRARLAVEATALARLQHPNIVQIFNSGTHEGRSFIVQEYVGGESLHNKLAHQPAPAQIAARTVATLARAVEHAHGQRIIHRDLKPSNVLLTVDGAPKISDFGLAKLSDDAGDVGQTQSGAIIGSPSYMAPEQSLAKPGTVGPPADIYSLGAILYEMLTGRPPFLAASTLETLDQVRTADPLSPRQLQPKLPRDLATICLKCLSKNPGHRYATAAALADDLDRFLEGGPILARPASRAERLAKWVKRRPATAASLGVAALAVIALFAGGLIYQSLLRAALKRAEDSAIAAQDQQREAEARYRFARETLNAMLDRFGERDIRQAPRLKELQRKQTADALRFYRELIRGRAHPNPAVRFDAAQACLQSSQAEFALGHNPEAGEHAIQATSLFEALVRDYPAVPDYRLALACSYRVRAYAPPASGDHAPGSADARALADTTRSREVLEELVAQDRQNRSYRAELAVTYHNLGCSESGAHNAAKAEAWFRKAVDLRRQLVKDSAAAVDAPLRVRMAESLQALAVMVQTTDHKEEVPQFYAESRALLEDVLRAEPNWDEATLSLGRTLFNWGVFLSYTPAARGQAERLLNEAVRRLTPIVDREPDWDNARTALVTSLGALAHFHEVDGRCADAVRWHEQVVARSKPENREEAQYFLALALARAGEHRKAWSLVQALRPSLAKRPADYHSHLALVCSVCLRFAENDRALSPQDRSQACSGYGTAAVELLRDALALMSEHERSEWLSRQAGDPDLAPLRRRADFQAFVGQPKSGAAPW